MQAPPARYFKQMKITLRETGGYAGTREIGSVDTDRLDNARAREIEREVADIGFFELPAEFSSDVEGFDIPAYELTVTDGTRRHQVTFRDDGTVPAQALRRIVQTVEQSTGG
jgi:hypothetical protein